MTETCRGLSSCYKQRTFRPLTNSISDSAYVCSNCPSEVMMNKMSERSVVVNNNAREVHRGVKTINSTTWEVHLDKQYYPEGKFVREENHARKIWDCMNAWNTAKTFSYLNSDNVSVKWDNEIYYLNLSKPITWTYQKPITWTSQKSNPSSYHKSIT